MNYIMHNKSVFYGHLDLDLHFGFYCEISIDMFMMQ